MIHTYTEYCGDPYYSLAKDRGYAEVFQYIKEYWIGLLFLYLAIKRRNFLYLSWSLLFGYLLLDDSFQIHEKLGSKVGSYFEFSPMLGLRAQDFGELIVSASFGSGFLGLIGLTYYFSDSSIKRTCRCLLVMLLVLVFFGIVMDMVDIMVKSPVWSPILGTVEDGGEMLIMSVIAWFVFLLPELEEN